MTHRLAKLDYEERSGKLVDAEEVTKAAFDDARVVRDRLLTIADRIASLLAAESDSKKVYNILASGIRDAQFEWDSGPMVPSR
ncbi:MAG: hypothetical protein HY238_02725 [Acidobacteria bacterium]|nr:hypothetical protein [Acidobacteriota bacterium]